MFGPRFSFTEEQISRMVFPLLGVYVLYERGEIIYIGQGNLQERLLSHVTGQEGSCTQGADQFAYEARVRCEERERELLEEFATEYGRLPKCNERR